MAETLASHSDTAKQIISGLGGEVVVVSNSNEKIRHLHSHKFLVYKNTVYIHDHPEKARRILQKSHIFTNWMVQFHTPSLTRS